MADTKNRRWSYSAGERGRNRVRAFEHASGVIMLEFYEPQPGYGEPKRTRLSTGHHDRGKAKQQADDAAAKLGKREVLKPTEITLKMLIEIYLGEVTPKKSAGTQKHDKTTARLILRCFGRNRRPCDLHRRDWDRFISQRRTGELAPPGGPPTGVGPRPVERELRWLLAVLNWATRSRDDGGSLMLERNPLRGLDLPVEKNPSRPVISDHRYRQMLTVGSEVDWRFEVALVIGHETGHRIGAIRQLRWENIGLDAGEIYWPEGTDKMGFEHVTAITPEAVEALQLARKANPGIGAAWVFPSPRDPSKPCSRYLVNKWWEKAEKRAKLDPIRGLRWHSLRRKFATDLKGVPLPDLCELGGWKTSRTILECYQQPDPETQRKALEERRRMLGRG